MNIETLRAAEIPSRETFPEESGAITYDRSSLYNVRLTSYALPPSRSNGIPYIFFHVSNRP